MNQPAAATSVTSDLLSRLQAMLGERVSAGHSLREQHGRGESWHAPQLPDLVCFPHSSDEVAAVVRVCAETGTAVIPFGSGTSLEAQVQALRGGVCIDLSQMNEVIEVNAEDMDCRVQAGVTRRQLNQYLRDTGLFFPIDPGADASLGGMTATRASGTNAVRYGTMRENVLGLTVVTASGDIIRTGTRARKSAAGYDLTRLFVGSEGTLGVITEVHLRLYGLTEAISAAIVNFPDIRSAAEATIQTIQMAIPVARIELLDSTYMRAINAYSKTDYPERDTLFLEFHGTQAGVAEQVAMFAEIARDFGGGDFQWADQESERQQLWRARHDAYYAGLAVKPGSRGYVTDVCVPISRLADCIAETQQDIAESNLFAPIVGHVGDGNFHSTVFVDPDDDDMMARVLEYDRRLVRRALDMGGTCTGEHGIGMGKLKHMRAEHGDGAVAVMQGIKQALDPQDIMNPGKVVDC
ncbi:MAG: FAD-linked oxidase C-terminal domain-containing protein [Gammaproteobacteria bacterium]|nr:FAD-linked oxidase C-terminal domain-containing protein [Gammaproteobacteria bacterium]